MVLFVLTLVCSQALLTVMTTSGPVTGVLNGQIASWKGIPFATPPVGSLRWTAPSPPPPWTSSFDASKFGPACQQHNASGYVFPVGLNFSEDCLTLNVWAPVGAADSGVLLDVMVWIYGGAFVNGGSAQLMYDGSYFASQNVIFVSLNYRLGYFGFLALNELSGPANGAFGFLDQQLALQWVQENIGAFGGDKFKVTLFGESAGACSTTLHITTPSSWKYFQRAIVQSAPSYAEVRPVAESIQLGNRLTRRLGCDDSPNVLSCMRSIPGNDSRLNQNTSSFPIAAVSFGGVVPLHPYIAIQNRVIFPGPLMGGNVLNEGSLFVYSVPLSIFTESFYRFVFPGVFAQAFRISLQDAFLAVARYPCHTYNASDCRAAAAALVGDFLLQCPTMQILLERSKMSEPVFAYMFAHQPSFSAFPNLGVYHSSELEFVFGTYPKAAATQQEVVLSRDMSASWIAFAKFSDPSTFAQGLWTPFGSSLSRRFLDVGPWTNVAWQSRNCSFWFNEVFPKYYSALSAAPIVECAADFQLCDSNARFCCTIGFECKRHVVSSMCSGTSSSADKEEFRCVGQPIVAVLLSQ